MRRLITCFNSLLLGVILGMIFVTIVDEPSSHLEEKVGANGFTIGCEILAITNQTTVLQIAGMTVQLIQLPAELCASLADHLYRASTFIVARSASLLRPANNQWPCRLSH